MSGVIRWVGRHEGLSLAGLALGIAQVVASPQLGITSLPGLVLLVVGSLLVGAIGGAWIVLRRRKHNVECVECVQTYEFSGKRGSLCMMSVAMLLRARLRIEAFVHSKSRASGKADTLSITYRNLGRDGRKNRRPPAFHALSARQLLETTDPSGETLLMVIPPAQVSKGDFVEVDQKIRARDSFTGDDEFVGKGILFPIKRVTFKLSFASGLAIANCSGTRYETGVPVGFETLTPTPLGQGGFEVSWDVEHAIAGEYYRVSWQWVEGPPG